jgi:hypothetical protein
MNVAIKEAIDAAIAERDKQWMEAIHPGNLETQFGRMYGTPEEYAGFRVAQLELEQDIAKWNRKKIKKLKRKIKKLKS